MSEQTINEIHQLLLKLNQKSDDQQKTLSDIKKELNSFNTRIRTLEEENIKLKNEVEEVGRKSRENNIIVCGLPLSETEEALNYLNDILGTKVDFANLNNIFFIPQKTGQHQLLKIEFISYLTKVEVLSNVRKLKGLGVSIFDDLNPADQIIHKALRSYVTTAKNKGFKATIRRNHLLVNKEEFTLEQLTADSDLLDAFSTNKEKTVEEFKARKGTDVPKRTIREIRSRIAKGSSSSQQN
ncbi:hypothetical protein JTB14_005762 [Gonioctena quinquepunctata]|nr:hypothetical protein JTB14_005762 [Gonioctena quinquepunctata]